MLRAYKEALSFVDALELFKRVGSCKSLKLDKRFTKKAVFSFLIGQIKLKRTNNNHSSEQVRHFENVYMLKC